MSFMDYGSRLQGSMGRYGMDIDTFKDSVINDKFSSIEKMFSPEISSTASTLTNLSNVKANVENVLGGGSASLEAIGSAVGVKKLYGAIKEKMGGKSLGDKKLTNEAGEEVTGETNSESNALEDLASKGQGKLQNLVSDSQGKLEELASKGQSKLGDLISQGKSRLEDLFGRAKSGLGDLKGNVQNKMSELQGNVDDKISEFKGNIQDKVNQMRGGRSADDPVEFEMREFKPDDDADSLAPQLGDEEREIPDDDSLAGQIDRDDIQERTGDTSIERGAGTLQPEEDVLNQGSSVDIYQGGVQSKDTAPFLKPQGLTNEAPTQADTTLENVSGDASKIENGLEDTETALKATEGIVDGAEAVEETTAVAGSFLDAIPIVGAIAGIGLQVGGAIFGAIEEGKEQALEKQESLEKTAEQSAEQTAQESIRNFTNTSFTGSTVVPTFSALSNMKNMGGGSGVF